jgi:ATP-dependent protease ClpP protease subunit
MLPGFSFGRLNSPDGDARRGSSIGCLAIIKLVMELRAPDFPTYQGNGADKCWNLPTCWGFDLLPNQESAMNDAPTPLKTDNSGGLTIQRMLFEPNLSINGAISEQTLSFFLNRLESIRMGSDDLIMELNTNGGDADVARRIALEIRLFAKHSGRRLACIGKSAIYSAGVTILAAFPRHARYLTHDAVLLVHERRLQSSLELNGPIKACLQIAREQVALLETAERLETESFEELVAGSHMTLGELQSQLVSNCYMTASEALKKGIIAEILS